MGALRKTHLNFIWQARLSDKSVTLRWLVFNKYGVTPLGMVKWHAPWRRYCFYPEAGTLYDAVCLRAIAKFCDEQTQKRKEARKAEALGPVTV